MDNDNAKIIEQLRAQLLAAQEEVERLTSSSDPKAWLITGSKVYQDAVVSTEAMADRRIAERGKSDVSHKVPLYEVPAAQLLTAREQGRREMREEAAKSVEAEAQAIRDANTYRGKVNQLAGEAAGWMDRAAANIRAIKEG